MTSIHDVESQLDLNAFVYKGVNVWPCLRRIIGWELIVARSDKSTVAKKRPSRLAAILRLIYSFKDVYKLFYSYDVIYLSDSDDYRVFQGRLVNRFTEQLSTDLSDLKILEIQKGATSLVQSPFDHVRTVPYNLIKLFIKLMARFDSQQLPIKALTELSKVSLPLDANKLFREFLIEQEFFTLLYQRVQAKVVLSSCYSYMPAIKAANDLGLQTLEFQHGTIVNHWAYDIRNDVEPTYYPQYFMAFGHFSAAFIRQSFYCKKESVVELGHYLLSLYKQSQCSDIQALKKEYDVVIAVTLQWPIQTEMLAYVSAQARENKHCCFVLIPRDKKAFDTSCLTEDNMRAFLKRDTYELIAASDFHLTGYSTCAEEAPFFGVQNIFLNINGLSKHYFADYIRDKSYNTVLEPHQSIRSLPQLLKRVDKDSVISESADIISTEYQQGYKTLVTIIRDAV